jgi:GAF domain-containing protein
MFSGSSSEALRALNILDTPREEQFDRITRAARYVFDVPMAAVNFIDGQRQRRKSEAGLPGLENTPVDGTVCRHTVRHGGALVIPDAVADERFRENRFVASDPNIRFYAGQPLRAPGGQTVGSLCVMDTMPRQLSAREAEALAEMGR